MGAKGEVVRIFVGGLDGSVTASDVESRFSSSASLGRVRGVELISKKDDGGGIGRSFNFAYIDFQPSSSNSLAKLFSTYNGCVWKGGRLRLEKPKEHYLARLKREWAEDAQLVNGAASDNVDGGEKNMQGPSKELGHSAALDKMQLRIFFPRLRKVKSLPYSGTGKHKYSFQRVEVPSLPIHFCDCDEHCTPLETAAGERLSIPSNRFNEINAGELDIMNSVMSKLFEREADMNAVDSTIASANVGNSFSNLVNDVPFYGMEPTQSTEEDNLVTNIVMEGTNSRSGSMQGQRMETLLMDRYSEYNKISNNRPVQKQTKAQKRKNTGSANASEPLNKKAHLLAADESEQDESSIKSRKRSSSEVHSGELENSAKAQPVENQFNSDENRSSRGLSWVQKSSWKELVGEADNSLFSIANVLPGITSMKQKLPKSSDLAVAESILSEGPKSVVHATVQSNRDGSNHLEVWKHGILKGKGIAPHDANVETSRKEEKIQAGLEGEKTCKQNLQISKDEFFSLCKEPEKKVVEESKTTTKSASIGEICTFMRSADSEKEWAKARAALSGALKKKTSESNPLKNSKVMSNRRL